MKKYDVKRVAVVTSIGAGDSKDQAPFMFKMLMMTVMSSASCVEIARRWRGARKLISTQVHLHGQEQPGGALHGRRRGPGPRVVHRAAGRPYCREADGCVFRVFLPQTVLAPKSTYPQHAIAATHPLLAQASSTSSRARPAPSHARTSLTSALGQSWRRTSRTSKRRRASAASAARRGSRTVARRLARA